MRGHVLSDMLCHRQSIFFNMHPNEVTLTRFYSAFADRNADIMADCYAENATFDDPAFSLRGRREVAGMWQMLCRASKSQSAAHWTLTFSQIQADDLSGRAQWEAHYLFSATGRSVHNIIEAQFTFTPDGRIATHRDHFDFWRWSRQALGVPGYLLGWSQLLQNKVRAQARSNLERYLNTPSSAK